MGKQKKRVPTETGQCYGERIILAPSALAKVPKQGQSLGVISPQLQLLMLELLSSELSWTSPSCPAGIGKKY